LKNELMQKLYYPLAAIGNLHV